jgi:hypothetical protein
MKVAIENRMMIIQIRNGLDLQVKDLTKRIEQLEEKERQDGEQKGGSS